MTPPAEPTLQDLLEAFRVAVTSYDRNPDKYKLQELTDARNAILRHLRTAEARQEGDEKRLQYARDAATYAAWRDMLSKFSKEQREQVAMMLAHEWLIQGVTLAHDDGRLHHLDARDYYPPYFSGVRPVTPPLDERRSIATADEGVKTIDRCDKCNKRLRRVTDWDKYGATIVSYEPCRDCNGTGRSEGK